MKIHRIILFLLLFCSIGIQAQNNLRDMVCVVKPQYSTAVKEFYENYGRALARDGYIKSGSHLMMMAKGSFGTGVAIEYNGVYYILTNFHVIEHANSVAIEFASSTGHEMQFNECEVIAKDKDYDLALIKFPDNAKIESGFTIFNTKLDEGTEVWSAGFPGIGNKPSWQLGKGIVSNSLFKDSVLNNSKLSYAIQHTAQVDAGSSGGPLLITNPETGYSIVGINTWKAKGREGANFAIPSNIVLAFLESTFSIEKKNITTEVTSQTQNLIKAGKSGDYKNVLPLVSNNYIFSISETVFLNMLSNASKNANIDANYALRIGEPFDAFRIVIADALYKKLQKSEVTNISSKDDASIVFSMVNGKETKMEWEQESGNWLLVNSTLLKKQKNNGGAIFTRDWDDVEKAIYVGIGIPLGSNEEKDYSFGYKLQHIQYFASFVEILYGDKGTFETDMPSSSESFKYWGGALGVELQLPLKFSYVYVIPFAKIPVGLNFGTNVSDVYIGVRPGVRFALKVGKNDNFLYLDAEYRYKHILSQEDGYKFPTSPSALGISLGFTF